MPVQKKLVSDFPVNGFVGQVAPPTHRRVCHIPFVHVRDGEQLRRRPVLAELGLLERFHETLKEQEVYWRLYDDPAHARSCLEEFCCRSNQRRPHWALVPETSGDPWVPEEVYAGGRTIRIPKWQGWARGAKERLDALLQETAA